ncbi:MAG: SDR family oxidoreductase [Comamonadaceae bacterium]|nr:MAG: SDR family oxidoreductase [Comamonadaceae bacterium]
MSRKTRTAVVTGAARGIGLAAARQLIEVGCQVALVDRDAQALALALDRLPASQALGVEADLAAPGGVESVQLQVAQRWANVDILVNNAAISPKHAGMAAGLLTVSLDEWQQVLHVNLTSAMLLAQRFVPGMCARRWGRIVNVSSRAGRSNTGSAGPAYATSKAALLGLTRSIATEFAPFNITANSVAPGIVETELFQTIAPELLQQLRQRAPLGRSAQPREIGAVIAFLASEDAGFITGTCLDVNGGAFMC